MPGAAVFGFESAPLPSAPGFSPIRLSGPGTPLLHVRLAGRSEVPAAITPRGAGTHSNRLAYTTFMLR